MAPKCKPSQSLPQLDFSARTAQRGDLIKRKGLPSTYQLVHIAHDGKTVVLCLMHGGSHTNFELRNISVETLTWME
jgi:hypothetical protein